MNLAHIHIVLNHVPSLGCILGLLLLAWALYTKNEALKKASFGLLVVVALATLPTYLSGNGARQLIAKQPVISLAMVEVHQNAAMLTLLAMTIAGAFAWFGLWEFRRFSRAGGLTTLATLLSTAAAAGLILYTGSLGGKISHPEIREAADVAVTEDAGWSKPIEEFLGGGRSEKNATLAKLHDIEASLKVGGAWHIPAIATLHYIGMVLLFAVSLLIVLRVLGVMKSIPFSAIHRLLPMAILGFVINVITGMLFYFQGPGGYLNKGAFQIKIACILLAAVPVLYFTVFDDPWQTGGNRNASALTKLAGVSAFTFLVGAIIYGRLIYISN